MKKNILFVCLTVFCSFTLHAEVLTATYIMNYGMFGQLGISDARLETKGDRYTIEISARTTGIVKRLSKNRQERYISSGHIVNGILVSDSLKIVRSHGKKYSEKIYKIDHVHKKVSKISISKKNGKISRNEKKILDFYSKNDLLTLYFNLPKMIDYSVSKTYKFPTVGAEKQGGKITLKVPGKDEVGVYEKTLGKGEYSYLTAIIYQKIFESNKGELMIAIGKEGVAEKAVLKDIVFYGDLVAERVK